MDYRVSYRPETSVTDRQTDGQTECKPIVPSGFTGGGLIKKINICINCSCLAMAHWLWITGNDNYNMFSCWLFEFNGYKNSVKLKYSVINRKHILHWKIWHFLIWCFLSSANTAKVSIAPKFPNVCYIAYLIHTETECLPTDREYSLFWCFSGFTSTLQLVSPMPKFLKKK